jgi:hypothetical protein
VPDRSYELCGTTVYECSREGPALREDRDAAGLINAAWNEKATLLVVPAERLGDGFFRLKTGIAGLVLQKFVTYGMRLAIVGDISQYVSESRALQDLVHECNQGGDVKFLTSIEELGEQLMTWAKPSR